jgi:hypothetical protein
MPRKNYAKAEVEAALAVIDSTRGRNGQANFSRASRELGIDRHTLMNWDADRNHPAITQVNPLNTAVIAELEAKLRGDFTERANELRFATLDRILELIPDECDLGVLTGTLSVVSNDSRLERG